MWNELSMLCMVLALGGTLYWGLARGPASTNNVSLSLSLCPAAFHRYGEVCLSGGLCLSHYLSLSLTPSCPKVRIFSCFIAKVTVAGWLM
jgi:hypothetical protein